MMRTRLHCIFLILLATSAGAFQTSHRGLTLSTLSNVSKTPISSARQFPRTDPLSRLAESKSSPEATTQPSNRKSMLSASALIGLDIFFRTLLQFFSISFPSSLAGCGVLFATFLLVPGGSNFYQFLSPGAALLAKWLPVFFVPSLITLPLAGSVGSAAEVLKLAVVTVGGFYFTLLSTAFTVVGVRKIFRPKEETKDTVTPSTEENEATPEKQQQPPQPSNPSKAFSDRTNVVLRATAAASGVAATIASGAGTSASTPLTALFMLSTTLMNFVFGARLPKKFTKVVHPLITCASLTWAMALAFAIATKSTFFQVLRGYRTKHLSLGAAGAGDILLFLLGPAVVSLSCSMYERRKLMKENILEVAAAVLVSAFGGVFGTATAVRALQIASPYLRLSLLSRNITSPLAMAIAGILGADVSLAVTIVVVTGLIGANFGASILDSFGIKDAVARGLGMGAAAHGLGTAAFVNEKDAFPFAAIAMALTASAATVIVSIPVFRRILLQLALGA